jgi:SulP family sulfate permease
VHFHPQNFVPFVAWLGGYRWRFLKPDLFAGLTVAVVAVPQSMAYALIAGLPVEYGLYASIVPTIVGCLWGSSAHLITGPTTTASLVVFSTLSPLAEPGGASYIQLALLLSLLVGLVKIVMGLARLGALLNFVSQAVLTGFTTGAAVLIAAKQLPGLLGLQIEKSVLFSDHLLNVLRHLHQIQPIPAMLGLGTILIIMAVKKVRPGWPGTLLAMGLAGGLVALLRLDAHGVAVVGVIPSGLPPLSWPTLETMHHFAPLAPGALAIALLGLVEAMSIARAIADATRQRLDVNQEFIGQGLANVAAALFSGYPGSGSFTRSAVNYRSGAKTPLSGIFSSLAVAVTLLLAAPLAAKLPMASLAGVLIVVAWEMVHPRAIARTVRSTRSDAAVLVVTFGCTLFLSIEFAIYVGVLLSIGLYLAATSHPRIYSVVPDLKSGKMVGSAYGDICCQMDIVHVEGSIFFGSTAFVGDDLQRRLRNHPSTTHLLIRMHKVNNLDASGVHILEILLAELRWRRGGLYFSGVNHRVFEVLKNSGFLKDVGENHVHTATGAAIRQAMREGFCAAVCAGCPVVVFLECRELKKGNWEIFGAGVTAPDCLDRQAIPHAANAAPSGHAPGA